MQISAVVYSPLRWPKLPGDMTNYADTHTLTYRLGHNGASTWHRHLIEWALDPFNRWCKRSGSLLLVALSPSLNSTSSLIKTVTEFRKRFAYLQFIFSKYFGAFLLLWDSGQLRTDRKHGESKMQQRSPAGIKPGSSQSQYMNVNEPLSYKVSIVHITESKSFTTWTGWRMSIHSSIQTLIAAAAMQDMQDDPIFKGTVCQKWKFSQSTNPILMESRLKFLSKGCKKCLFR